MTVENILVRSPNWVGDVVMATPAFRCIRENFPAARIALVIRPYAAKVIDDAPWFDDVVACDDKNADRGMLTALKLRRYRFDLAIIFPGSFMSALAALAAGAKRRVGYIRDARGLLLTDGLKRPSRNGKFLPTYMGDYYLALCEHIGCRVGDRRPQLFVSGEAEEKAQRLLKSHGVKSAEEFALINPGASFGASKYWREERFARVADMLADEYDMRILVSGAARERQTAENIVSQMKSPGIVVAGEIGLDTLKALVRKCGMLVTLDSGPRHFAVAFRRPVATIMGPNSPLYTQTDYENGAVVRVDVDCGPCQEKSCKTDHRCMELITPEMVFDACRKLIGPVARNGTRGERAGKPQAVENP